MKQFFYNGFEWIKIFAFLIEGESEDYLSIGCIETGVTDLVVIETRYEKSARVNMKSFRANGCDYYHEISF